MDKNILITEGLDFHDMEGQLEPLITVDEYSAKMGDDKDIITLTFMVRSEEVASDLVDWFERGYDWVLDASVSEGELEAGKYLVFVEMNRRSVAPARIVELLKDLKTLTNMKLSEWDVQIDNETYDPDEKVLRQVMILNPNLYKADQEKEEELNEMRRVAGIEVKTLQKPDKEIRDFIAKAGL
jgi:hypothetical protein